MTQNLTSSCNGLVLDAAVIGAGFGGLYALYKLRDDLGLNAQGFDDAGGVGGTWFWNRYPGCRTDTMATVYSYSFDHDMVKSWKWSEKYPRQQEVLAYLNAVSDKHDLKRSINFNTRIVKASWDEASNLWHLETTRDEKISARFLIEAVGLLSSTNMPAFRGLEQFTGHVFHAARWPEAPVDLAGKRIAVIGTGSTGIQLISEISHEASHLYVLQRTPQYVVPAKHGPVPEQTRKWIEESYPSYHQWAMNSATVFGIHESSVPAMSVSSTEREEIYQKIWDAGGGFTFMLATFADITTSTKANQTATDFIRNKIHEIVNDRSVAKKLCPTDYYAKRPLCADGYYETFNRSNVSLIDLNDDPIQEITPTSIRTKQNEIAVDAIILATGFDAFTGNYLKIETTGRNGVRLQEKWSDGPEAFMGIAISGFPNLFMVYGPFGPFTSQPLVHEFQVNWFCSIIKYIFDYRLKSVEVSAEFERKWVKECEDIANLTLFAKTDSWINGANIPGKPKKTMVYMGGMIEYSRRAEATANNLDQYFIFV